MSDEEIERAAVEELLQEAKKAEEASLPTRSQPQSCINRRLLCRSLASTLRNPILPKAVSKRKYVGLDEPNFDADVEKKRPNAGQEYDPDGDYIYDARKYFNPEKYREIIANQEEKKKKQQETQQKFYYRAYRSHRRHYYNSCNTDVDVTTDRLRLPASSLQDSEYSICDVDKMQGGASHSNSHHKKPKKKSKQSRHRKSQDKQAKLKKSDKKHKKKQKQKKSGNTRSKSLGHNHRYHSNKHRAKLQHSSQHRSKLFSSQERSASVTCVTNCDYSYRTDYLDENSIGNDYYSSDISCLPDNSVGDLNCRHSRYKDNDRLTDSVENYSDTEDNLSNSAQRPVIGREAADVWEDDSSDSSEYSDMHKDFSQTNDDSNDDVN